jgi:hypothetical protein
MGSETRLKHRDPKMNALTNMNIRPFTSSSAVNFMRHSYEHKLAIESDNEVEMQLRRIDEKLARGSLNHLKNLFEKSKIVKASNEIVDKVNSEYRKRLKLEEQNKMNSFVER